MTVALLTAIYDGYDDLKELVPQDVEVETICVTDDLNLKSPSWNCVYEARGDIHPNVAAKRPKMRPWDYTNADWTIWLDASFRVISSAFVREVLEYGPIGQIDHPDRDCLYEEAEYSAGLKKYAGLPLQEQAQSYWPHPTHWGLWCTGLIVREHQPEIVQFGERWLDECEKWSYQDQVSEPAVLRQCGLRPATIPGDYFKNRWFLYEGSARH